MRLKDAKPEYFIAYGGEVETRTRGNVIRQELCHKNITRIRKVNFGSQNRRRMHASVRRILTLDTSKL